MSVEVIVKFSDGYTVVYPLCETGMVSYGRCAAWLTRFPAARTREYTMRREINLIDQQTGDVTSSRAERTIMVIIIDIQEKASPEIRDLCALL
jgi:hypothetical protein